MPKPEFYGAEDPPETAESLVSRTDKKRARRVQEDALERLAQELVQLSDGRLEQLELSDPVVDAVQAWRRITSPAAKNRQLRLVRAALRDEDWAVIRTRVSHLVVHGTLPERAPGPEGSSAGDSAQEARWVVRLLGEGSIALEALISSCPQADRAHLRQLIRAVQRSTAERRHKAEQKLLDCVRSTLRSSAPRAP